MTHRLNVKAVKQDGIVGGLKRKGEKKMARYIDAVELIKAIEENQRNTEHHKDGRGKQIHVSEHRHFIKMVYEQPTADVQEVRHGRWLPIKAWFDDDYSIESDNEHYQTSWKCSLCGRIELIKEPYCHCGAKMDLEE